MDLLATRKACLRLAELTGDAFAELSFKNDITGLSMRARWTGEDGKQHTAREMFSNAELENTANPPIMFIAALLARVERQMQWAKGAP